MTETLRCAICGHAVPLDMDYVALHTEEMRAGDHSETQTYYVHEPCARSVTEGWSKP